MGAVKRGPLIVMIVLLAAALAYAGYRIYDHYRGDSLLERIVNRDGYTIEIAARPVSVDIAVKPEWLLASGETEKRLDVPVGYVHNTLFVLEKVTANGSGMYFSFKGVPELNQERGEFLYTLEVHDDGTASSYMPEGLWTFYKPGKATPDRLVPDIQFGPGQGPDTHFGFSMNSRELTKLGEEGFTVVYSGLILYTYSKI